MSLNKWYAALANRYWSATSVVVLGDSNSEGTGATSVNKRWQQLLQAQLRAQLQPAGVTGASVPYISASPRLSPVPPDYGLTVSGTVGQQSYGLGLRAADVTASQSVTFTFTGTRAKLFAAKGSAAGKFSIVLDGGAAVVVDALQVAFAPGSMLWDSGPLTAGPHTVVVSRSSTTTVTPGPVFPEGLRVYNGDEFAGVRVVDASRHGATLDTFNGSTSWHAAFTAIEHKGLLILPWGANDVVGGVTATDFRTKLETLIATCRSKGFAGSVLLVKMPKRLSASESAWSGYLAQMDAIAAADPDVSTVNLRAVIPDAGAVGATGLYVDDVHYTDAGQQLIADNIAAAIMPPTVTPGPLTYDEQLSRVRLSVARVPSSAVSVAVERSTDLVRWATVRGAAEASPIGGAVSVDDYEFAADVSNHYRVRAYGADAVEVGATLNGNPNFETDISGWTPSDGATLTRSTTQAHQGAASMLLTPSGTGANPRAESEWVPVTAGADYRFSAWVRCAVTRNVELQVLWYNAAGVLVGDNGTGIAATAGVWVYGEATRTAPVGATQATVAVRMVSTPPAGHLLHMDEVSIARSGSGPVFSGSIAPTLGGVWLKSLARPFLNRQVTVRDFSEVTRPSRAGVFEVVGRSYPVAVTDLRSSRRWTLDVSTYSPEDADVLDLLAASGDILLVHVPAGAGRLSATPGGYVTVGDTREVTPPTVDLAMRVFTLPCVEVAAPGPDVVGTTATCQTVLSTYATCTAVLAAHPTCVSLMELVADPEDVIVS